MDRRGLLSSLCVGGAVLLGGCSGLRQGTRGKPGLDDEEDQEQDPAPSPTPGPPYADRFDRVVDVTQSGADRSGGESIVPLVKEELRDDTLLYFPEGEYLIDDRIHRLEFSNIALVGRDATFVPEPGLDAVMFDLGRANRASDILLDGLTFDFTASDTGPRPINVQAGGRVVVRDVSVRGTQDTGDGMMRFDVTHPEGIGVVERLRLPDGSTRDVDSAGCLVGDNHRGQIQFFDCHIEGFSNNGLYAEPERGSVQVHGGYFANCRIASLRVGSNSYVSGAHVRCDRSPDDFGNMRGLRLRQGRNILVEDTLIEMVNVSGSEGGLVLAPWLEEATIRNTIIRVEFDGISAIRMKGPADASGFPGGGVRFEDISIVGAAAGGAAVNVTRRDGVQFEGVLVEQSGANRDGFVFDQTNGATVSDATIRVTGEPIVRRNSTVRTVNVRYPGPRDQPPLP
jgi:hypothetical protein